MKEFKLAIIIDTCKAGGVSKALNDFIKFICEFFEITLFVKDVNSVDSFELPYNVKCCGWPEYSKPKTGKEYLYNRKNKLFSLLNSRNFARKTVYESRLYCEIKDSFDCAIGYQMISNDVTIMTLEKIKAKRKILWLHGKKNFADRNLQFFDKLYSKADLIVAVSKDTEERFIRLMPRCAEKTTTIHNFYDFNLIYRKSGESIGSLKKYDNEVIIVSTGRLSKEKGFDRVPKATQMLVKDGYNIHWFIVGDGEKKDDIKKEICELELDKFISLTGYIENPYPYIKQCDIYVQPSLTEGFCTSTMEAKILKKPVVTTDVPGMNEQFINGVDGLIVESSVEGIYSGIKKLIDNKSLYKRILKNLNSEPMSNEENINKVLKILKR